jgi:hypothetical protein
VGADRNSASQNTFAGSSSPYDVFLTPNALAINRARQEHLASIGLDLNNKRILEVGAGIGLHTDFFLNLKCDVTVTDGNKENVSEIRRRHPTLRSEVLDLELNESLSNLGSYDLVYCYGLLYHLKNAESALARLAEVCSGQILLETCVSLGQHEEIIYLQDFISNNQAVSGIGSRPTRIWVQNKLKEYFGYAYIPITQPDHPDFPLNWDCPNTNLLYRSIFVGSKVPLNNESLQTNLPSKQLKFEVLQK